MDSPEIKEEQIRINKLQRKKLIGTEDWPEFQKSEYKQLNRYKDAGMFGKPVPMEHWMTVLPWVWTYLQKENPITGIDAPKARGTCNGGPRYSEAVTLAETYAACVEQPIHRLTWSIAAALTCTVKAMMSEMHLPKHHHRSILSLCIQTHNFTNGGRMT